MKHKRAPIPESDDLQTRILTLRGQKVIIDADLAAIYGVTTKRLNEQVKRNAKRFPADFMFQLTREEFFGIRSQFVTGSPHPAGLKSSGNLRSQFATSSSPEHEALASNRSQFATGSKRHHDPRFLPYAFTENGAVMAANVLNSPEAVRMSVHVVRAFIQMRALLSGSKELAIELKKLEAKLTSRLDTHEVAITEVLRRIMRLLDPPPGPDVPDKEMGFHTAMRKPRRYTRLAYAPQVELVKIHLHDEGRAICWETLDEEIQVEDVAHNRFVHTARAVPVAGTS